MADETSADVFGNEVEKTTEGAEKSEELAGEDTSETEGEDTSETELDSVKKALTETQEQLKRYKEQVSGSQEEALRLKKELDETKAKIPQEKQTEPDSELTSEDRQYKVYLKKLGLYSKDEIEKMVQEKVAPFQAEREARNRSEQRKVLDEFIKKHPDLEKDERMVAVKDKLRKIAPSDPFNPNLSLGEDLEHAYKWAFEGETNQEALSKAKAEGRAEGHEASETKVGEGASTSSETSKVQRTSEQEDLLKRWGVADEDLTKKESK